MKIILNGQTKEITDQTTLNQLINTVSAQNTNIIVEINKNIITKDKWKNTTLYENDHIELVTFVGGG